MSGIFISYRRSDNPDATGRIYDRLVAEFGKARVFKDVDSIPLGQDFRGHLNSIVGDCAAVLAIIGPKWTDARNSAGQRRLEDADDFVRIELEAALARDVPVVPVLVAHAPMPGAAELPISLASMAFRQSIEVRPDPDFHNDATRLIAALRRILDPSMVESESTGPVAVAVATPVAAPTRRSWTPWIVAMVAIAAAAAALILPGLQHWRELPAREIRAEIMSPESDWPLDFALSPDGQYIAFVARDGGTSRLWLRRLDSTTARPMPGTDGARQPFWSPDSRSIGFISAEGLKRMDLEGGRPWVIKTGNGATPAGASWGANGDILFAPSPLEPLLHVLAKGGALMPATTVLRPGQRRHFHPRFLPDGRRFIFFVEGLPSDEGIYLGSLDGKAPVRLVQTASPGEYLSSGWLLWMREGSLISQRLDAERAVLTGEQVVLAEGVTSGPSGDWELSVAGNGLIAYRTGANRPRQLQWFDRSGGLRGVLGNPDESYGNPRISPDGHRVAVDRTTNGNTDIWLLDGIRASRFTVDPQLDARPLWSPDGKRIVFYSTRGGQPNLYSKSTDGVVAETRLLDSAGSAIPIAFSPDGHFLLHLLIDSKGRGLYLLPTGENPKAVLWLQAPLGIGWGSFSPDGRWIAFGSSETGRFEVFVRRYLPPDSAAGSDGSSDAQSQISVDGGTYPTWRPDGKELYFLGPGGDMMAAPIAVTGTTLSAGAPAKLFPTRIYGGGFENGLGRQYDVGPDGRFLINSELDAAAAPPITLIQNWNPEAKKAPH
jgi:eukaryotic-like serine/threonine-protein kinase